MNEHIVSLTHILIPLLLLASPGDSSAQKKTVTAFPSVMYGSWRIQRVEEVGGHGRETPDLARGQIGREIHFSQSAMVYDKGTLYFGRECRGLRYTVKRQRLGKQDVGEKGTLDFYGLGPARDGWIQYVVVRCRDGAEYAFEMAEDKRLAVYYDGWFFFLEKVR